MFKWSNVQITTFEKEQSWEASQQDNIATPLSFTPDRSIIEILLSFCDCVMDRMS